jgi:hypothetical protein
MMAELSIGGKVIAAWDPVRHPDWPPIDDDGKVIGDVPWKFFEPPR